MKGMRILVPLWALLLAACGDGSIQSPDFTSALTGITAQDKATHSSAVTGAAGKTVQFEAIGKYTVPPGSEEDFSTGTVDDASWDSSDATVATIDGDGLATLVSPGTATITAKKSGFESQATLTVTEAEIVTLSIARANDATQTPVTADNLARGTQRAYVSVATLSNGAKAIAPLTTWATSNAANVELAGQADPTATKILSAPSAATPNGISVITASTPGPGASTISANVTITVTGAELQGNLTVQLDPASPIPINSTTQATAYGQYSDGSTQALSNSNGSIAWSSSDETIATVNPTSGLVTTVAEGTTNIVAKLNAGFEPQVTGTRTASTPLLVTGTVCTSPLLAPATVTVTQSALCLLCSVDQPDNLVDASSANYAQANIGVGLLTLSSITVDVHGTQTFPGGPNTNAGFIVGHPAGTLVSAELLAQVTVSTYLGSNPTGDTSSDSNPLTLDLLGTTLIGNNDQALISIASTKSFDSLRLTYNGGLLTALSGLQIYSACGTTAPPAATP
jgi:hypothetical protein